MTDGPQVLRARTRPGRRRGLVLGAALALGAGALTACQLPGPTFVVTTTADGVDATPGDGACETALGNDVCTLRAAVMEANAQTGTNNIELGDGATYVLTLAGGGEDGARTGDLDIAETVAVNGRSTIDAAQIDRVLDVRAGTLILDGPTITGGAVGQEPFVGGGIRVTAGASLAAGNTTIAGNAAKYGGGGIDGAGAVTLLSSTVRDNTTDGRLDFEGPWIAGPGAGVAVHSAPLSVTSSSITRNRINVYGSGAGLHADGTGQITIERSTISGNDAAGINGDSAAVAGPTVTVQSSTVADNRGGAAVAGTTVSLSSSTITTRTDPAVVSTSASARGTIITSPVQACAQPLTSLGFNLASDASCGLGGPGDQSSVNPTLGPLADNGGPTATRLPFANSPAVDAIPAGTPSLCDSSVPTDQRGRPRRSGPACDIGAVEGWSSSPANPLDLVVDDAGDATDLAPGDGACRTATGTCTLRAAIDETNAWPVPDTVTIAPGVNPTPDAEPAFPAVSDSLVLLGGGSTVTAPASTEPGLVNPALMVAFGTVTIEDIHLVGSGGLLLFGGTVTVSDSWVSGARNAGILVREPATLTLERSTSSGNLTGVAVDDTAATIVQSTLVDNQDQGLLSSNYLGDNDVQVIASTIAGPADGSASAITTQGSGAPVRVRGSVILSNGTAPTCTPGAMVSDGYNVIRDLTCGAPATGDATNTNPLLLPLWTNGGPTPTRLPYANSPAVGRVPIGTPGLCDGTLPTDQRGSARPVGSACDAGSVEGASPAAPTAPLALTVTSAVDARDTGPGDGVCASTAGPCTLRAAVDETNGWPGADTITIGAGVNPTLTIAGAREDANATGDLDLLDAVAILGGGATVDANHLDGAFDHFVGTSTISSMTVRGGAVDPDGIGSGAVRQRSGATHLSVRSSVITANDGHGIEAASRLTVTTSAITGNGYTGVTNTGTEPTTIDRTTISGNAFDGVSVDGPATVTRSTITGASSPAIRVDAGGFAVTITASTLTTSSPYGTVRNDGWGSVVIRASAFGTVGGTTCVGSVTSGGYNRYGGPGCTLAAVGDLKVPDLGLGPLANNGGGTQTRLPTATSTLLDVIPTGTAGLCDASLATDQRGQPRPQGPGCDVGAVERTP